MPSTFKITVDVSQLSRLQPWAATIKSRVAVGVQQAFHGALPAIQGRERVRTGNMRDSTTMTTSTTGATITASAGYSGYQNFGTRYMTGTHFMEAGVSNIMSALPSTILSSIAI
jgi:hypothetical protein